MLFFMFFRALWLVPSIATGAPLPFYTLLMGRVGACAHEEVNVTSFVINISSILNKFSYF